MQFRVPQNITMEDRIVGPLSPIQFGIVVIGGGFSFFVLQSTWLPAYTNTILAGFLALFTVVLSVGKFNGQPMYHFIKFLVMFVVRPRVRIWHKEGGEVTLIKASPPKTSEHRVQRNKLISHQDIARLAMVLDSRGSSGVVPQIHTVESKK